MSCPRRFDVRCRCTAVAPTRPAVRDYYRKPPLRIAGTSQAGSVRVMPDALEPLKPRLRGVLHQWACAGSVPLGLALVLVAGTARARVALSVYAVSLVALFGVSALYHRINWRSVTGRDWMRRLDHSMIFVLIAGSYTPFAVLVLHGSLAVAILVG